jgi:hypothetical protein
MKSNISPEAVDWFRRSDRNGPIKCQLMQASANQFKKTDHFYRVAPISRIRVCTQIMI